MTHNDDRPTSQKTKNVIDLVISSINISHNIKKFQVLEDKISDHWQVTFDLNKIVEKTTHTHINWKKFQTLSEEFIDIPIIAIESSSQIEQELDFLNSKLVESIKNCTKTLKQNAARIKIPDYLALKIKTKKIAKGIRHLPQHRHQNNNQQPV